MTTSHTTNSRTFLLHFEGASPQEYHAPTIHAAYAEAKAIAARKGVDVRGVQEIDENGEVV